MPIERWIVAVAIAASIGCESRDPAPFAPVRDGSIAEGGVIINGGGGRRDGSVGRDSALDLDGGQIDAGTISRPPVIDGLLGEGEWAGALVAESDVAPAAAFPFDALARVYAIRTDARLYLAIDGTVGPDRLFVLLLDEDFGDGDGVVLTPSALDDFVGSLDRALSASGFSTSLAEFQPDYAWGAPSAIAIDGSDDLAGWRDIRIENDFFPIDSARTVCSTICETSIPLGSAGIQSPGLIALAVRTTDTTGALSNQMLPRDLEPSAIEAVLAVPAPGATAP